MNNPFQKILINSSLAFVTAFLITTFIHESGHFISYLLFAAHPVLYHNHVQIPDLQLSQPVKVLSALAGPVVSLIQGIFFAFIFVIKSKRTVKYLLFLWLALLGYINFFGYLLMTPFSSAGDTGKAADMLAIDVVYRYFIAAAGLAAVIYIVNKLGRHFAAFIPSGLEMDIRRKYVYHIMFFPVIIGSIFNTIFAFPVPAILSVIYPATSSFVIMSSFSSILNYTDGNTGASNVQEKLSKGLVILTVACILGNRLLTLGMG